LGSNEEVTFTSGETWQTVGYGGDVPDHWSNSYDRLWSDERLAAGTYRGKPFDDLWQVLYNGPGTMKEPVAMNDIQSGDSVNVVWTAESGGKTQTLFKYTVQ
jgi:hypothetical protein